MKKILFIIILTFAISLCTFAQQTNPQIDTTHYHLPYRDSTIHAASGEGYIDTFSIANAHFRLIHEDTTYDAIVEKNINGIWIRCLDTLEMGNHNDYALKDINGDGYEDFVHDWKWFGEVYFFDPQLDNFLNVSTASTQFEWALIDSVDNDKYRYKIFCDFREGKQMKGQIHSTLFIYKGLERQELYDLELDNLKEDSLITGLILYKEFINEDGFFDKREPKEIQRIKFAEPINLNEVGEDYFDYVKFWKERYKKLLDLK